MISNELARERMKVSLDALDPPRQFRRRKTIAIIGSGVAGCKLMSHAQNHSLGLSLK